MAIKDFYENTTKNFTGTITLDSGTPDITGDVVTFTLKKKKTDTDAIAIIVKTANVSIGAGKFEINLTKADTTMTPGEYYYDLVWDLSTGARYVLEEGTINALDKISDNS